MLDVFYDKVLQGWVVLSISSCCIFLLCYGAVMGHLPPYFIPYCSSFLLSRPLLLLLSVSEFFQLLEVKMTLLHCREVLYWKVLPPAGIALLIFLLEDTIPGAFIVPLWGALLELVSQDVYLYFSRFFLSVHTYGSPTLLCEREGLLLIMEQLKRSFLAALGRGCVEMLVSRDKKKRHKWQIMRAVWRFVLFCCLPILRYGDGH